MDPGAQGGVGPGESQDGKDRADDFVKQLAKNAPEAAETAFANGSAGCQSGHEGILAQKRGFAGRQVAGENPSQGAVWTFWDRRQEGGLYPEQGSPRIKLQAKGEQTLQLDDHLKNLLRELGHAINDTVSESDRITGAIAGVRAHGYDIVLKLDATIGLARRDGSEEQPKLTNQDRRFLESLRIQVDQDLRGEERDRLVASKLAMTPQDVRFLKSLRIAVDEME